MGFLHQKETSRLKRETLKMADGLLERVFGVFGKGRNGAVYRENLESAIADELTAGFSQLKEQVPDSDERRQYLKLMIRETESQLRELNGHPKFSYSLILDEEPADKGKKKTQDQHIEYWDNFQDSGRMASMGDLYVCFKHLKSDYEAGTSETKARISLFLDNLREDFLWEEFNNFLIARTRVVYSSDGLNAKTIQHYGSKDQNLIKETEIPVEEYWGAVIVEVAAKPRGLKYLQILLDTDDVGEEIVSVLEFISGKDKKWIQVWSAPINSTRYYTRSERPERAAALFCSDGSFQVGGYDLLNIGGRSRGVKVNPR